VGLDSSSPGLGEPVRKADRRESTKEGGRLDFSLVSHRNPVQSAGGGVVAVGVQACRFAPISQSVQGGPQRLFLFLRALVGE
jgi:hypothetical protein